MRINKLQQGSALVITVLFGTVALALTLAVATFTLSTLNQSARIEEGTTANYANEGAMEVALAQYNKKMSAALPNWKQEAQISSDNLLNCQVKRSSNTIYTYFDVNSASMKDLHSPCQGVISYSNSPSIVTNVSSSAFILPKKSGGFFGGLSYKNLTSTSYSFLLPRGFGQKLQFAVEKFNGITGTGYVDLNGSFTDDAGLPLTHPISPARISIATVGSVDTYPSTNNMVLTFSIKDDNGPNSTATIDFKITPTIVDTDGYGLLDNQIFTIMASTVYGSSVRQRTITIPKSFSKVTKPTEFTIKESSK